MSVNVCYFVQTHRDPEQVYRLVQHDPAACELDPAPLAGLPDVHLLPPRGPQVRSNFSCQSAPYLGVIDWLERERVPYDWLVNLTGKDYPVTPVARIEAFLDSAR